VTEHFVPVKIHVKEQPQDMKRFGIHWTPTLLVCESDSTERRRIEGFLPAPDLLAQLQLGLAAAAFAGGRYEEAQRAFEAVVNNFPETGAAAEAVYWAGVSNYKITHNREILQRTGARLRDHYPGSDWAKKGSVWVS